MPKLPENFTAYYYGGITYVIPGETPAREGDETLDVETEGEETLGVCTVAALEAAMSAYRTLHKNNPTQEDDYPLGTSS